MDNFLFKTLQFFSEENVFIVNVLTHTGILVYKYTLTDFYIIYNTPFDILGVLYKPLFYLGLTTVHADKELSKNFFSGKKFGG